MVVCKVIAIGVNSVAMGREIELNSEYNKDESGFISNNQSERVYS